MCGTDVRFSDFFTVVHEIMSHIILLAVGLEIAFCVNGEKLAYLYRGLCLPVALTESSNVLAVEKQDLGREMCTVLRVNVPLQCNADHQLQTFVRDLLHAQGREELKKRAQEVPVADAAGGLLDESVLREVQKFHPVNLMRPHPNLAAEKNASDSWVGVCLCKSDRIWKNGQLNALCGIAAGSQHENSSCLLHLYDHHGIMIKGSEIVHFALQKGAYIGPK